MHGKHLSSLLYRKKWTAQKFLAIDQLVFYLRLWKFLGNFKKIHSLDWVFKINLIPSKQYGFLPGSSTCTQMIDCTNIWTRSLNEGRNDNVVYSDLVKALDTVSHTKLLQKLESIGIQNNVLAWFSSYFSGRKMIVRYSSSYLFPRDCPLGVPQCEFLSPSSS